MIATQPHTDFTAVKSRQQATWSSGDYAVIGTTLAITVDVFRTYYGPVLKAFAALDAAGQADLDHELTELLGRFNQGGADTLAVPSEYIEVVATRR